MLVKVHDWLQRRICVSKENNDHRRNTDNSGNKNCVKCAVSIKTTAIKSTV